MVTIMKMRKNHKQLFVGFIVFLLVGTISCTDHFTDLNTPPDTISAENVDVALLGQAFAYTQYWAMFGPASPTQTAHSHYSDIYVQYQAQTAENFDSDQFQSLGRRPNSVWNWFYGNTALQLKFVEDVTLAENLNVQNAVAKIWRVHAYHRMSDYWGPIIYSEFGSGETSVGYDSQESVYMDFFSTLDEAVAVLQQNPGSSAFGTNDLVYAGNVNQWIQLANSLRLRLAMRISYVEPTKARSEAEKAINAGVISSNTDNAEVKVTSNSTNGYNTITNWGEFRMSATMQSVLEGFQDPRLGEYYSEAQSGGGYKGMRNGLPRTLKPGSLNSDYSDMDDRWKPANQPGPPIPVLKASEVSFLRAEGALRGWNMGGTAQEFYEEGIRLSMEEWTDASLDDISAYINSTNTPVALNDLWDTPAMSDIQVVYDAGAGFEEQLEQIITQKWIALYPLSWEAWSERRRTGYPRGFAILSSLNPNLEVTDLFRRIGFTENEYANNAAAVQEAIGLLREPTDGNHIRLWWDEKPIEDYPVPRGN